MTILILIAEFSSVLLPFLFTFRRDWRYGAKKTTGILLGYLLFVCILFLMASPLLDEFTLLDILWSCISLFLNSLLCSFLVKLDFQVIFYALFLFKNFSDGAVFLAQAMQGFTLGLDYGKSPALLEELYLLLFYFVLSLSAWHLLSFHLQEAVKHTRSLPIWKPLTLIPVFFFFMFNLNALGLSPEIYINSYPRFLLIALCWLCCLYTVHYVTLRTLSRLAQSYAIKEQLRTSRFLTSLQTSQMEELQANLEQMKQARHDFRHQLITLKGLLLQSKTKEALDYIENYLGTMVPFDNVTYCSNIWVNSLLNYYLEIARQHFIQVSVSVSLPEKLPMPDIDFCTILGNLLANAVESCLRQTSGTPFISINMGQAGQSMITISIRNTYTHEICCQEGRFLSSKRRDFGTGTTSVRSLAERYHGILNYTYENGIFEASLLLNPQMA